MKLKADVEMVNRDLPVLNMKNKGRAVHSFLSIGRKPRATLKAANSDPDPEIFILLSTMQNRSGTKYAVRENVGNIFAKFVDEGKATIRFIRPPFDMCIKKADPLQLKAFLGVMKKILALIGDCKEELDKIVELQCSTLGVASLSQVSKDKTSLTVSLKKDYPITTNFPHGLTDLRVNDINLKRFDTRIFKLKCLTHLDLSRNAIPAIPPEVVKLERLSSLILRDNKITSIPIQMCCHQEFCVRLKTLDLGLNSIKVLPSVMGKLNNLVVLHLDGNPFPRLPPGLLTRNLKKLDISDTPELPFLPSTAQNLHLDTLVTSSKSKILPTPEERNFKAVWVQDTLSNFPTLLDLCAKFVISSRMRKDLQEDSLPGSILELIDSAVNCRLCGSICCRSSCAKVISLMELNKITSHVTLSQGQRSVAKIESVLCSWKCAARLKTMIKKDPMIF